MLDSRDLRSGMALIAAALAAEGAAPLSPLETVERGYADVVGRLQSLGAAVEVSESVTARRRGPAAKPDTYVRQSGGSS